MDLRSMPKLRRPLALRPITVFTVKAIAGVSLFPWKSSPYMTKTANPTNVAAIGISCSKLHKRNQCMLRGGKRRKGEEMDLPMVKAVI